MQENEFVNGFVARIGDMSEEELSRIKQELSIFMSGWDVKKRSTELAVYEECPVAFKAYLVTKKIEGRSPKTLDLYKLVLEDMIRTIRKELATITTNDLRLYLYNLKDQRNISDRTLDHRRLILSGFFTWCYDEKYIPSNPTVSLSPIKYEVTPRKSMTDTQMERMRDACKTAREKAILEVLYSTGCRCSELTNLKRSDIDLATREVKLYGKGRKHRKSYINARAEIALKNYLAERTDVEEWLFVSERKPHHQLTKSGIEKIIHILGDRAGIKDAYPHRIRHTFATDALNRGMPVTDLQVLMGHESIDTTTIYAKASQLSISTNHHKYVI
jgi:site-specific recombinase XerD